RAFPRDRDMDFLAQAYDQIYLAHPSRDLIDKAFAAGAFRMVSASRLLEAPQPSDPEVASSLFSELAAAFPVENPGSEDILYLLRVAGYVAKWNRQLALEAIDKAVSAADGSDGPNRTKLMSEVAGLLSSIDPQLLKRYQAPIKDLALHQPDSEEKKDPEHDPAAASGKLQKLPFADAVEGARQIEEPLDRTFAFIELSRREELSPQQRSSLASEALTNAAKIPMSG